MDSNCAYCYYGEIGAFIEPCRSCKVIDDIFTNFKPKEEPMKDTEHKVLTSKILAAAKTGYAMDRGLRELFLEAFEPEDLSVRIQDDGIFSKNPNITGNTSSKYSQKSYRLDDSYDWRIKRVYSYPDDEVGFLCLIPTFKPR